ncbi:hypothetical protein Ciccas_007667 [Cichlidogyrus casuarinus]|uniref:Uncharacterized protein n=1 Tax=Cichlidogyrus casuarinus TaxID=1844966 RepID=A0ABD2Q2W9_9PLAT
MYNPADDRHVSGASEPGLGSSVPSLLSGSLNLVGSGSHESRDSFALRRISDFLQLSPAQHSALINLASDSRLGPEGRSTLDSLIRQAFSMGSSPAPTGGELRAFSAPGSASPFRLGRGQFVSKTEVKKCRRMYGVNHKDQWCNQCKWKKACTRFSNQSQFRASIAKQPYPIRLPSPIIGLNNTVDYSTEQSLNLFSSTPLI